MDSNKDNNSLVGLIKGYLNNDIESKEYKKLVACINRMDAKNRTNIYGILKESSVEKKPKAEDNDYAHDAKSYKEFSDDDDQIYEPDMFEYEKMLKQLTEYQNYLSLFEYRALLCKADDDYKDLLLEKEFSPLGINNLYRRARIKIKLVRLFDNSLKDH